MRKYRIFKSQDRKLFMVKYTRETFPSWIVRKVFRLGPNPFRVKWVWMCERDWFRDVFETRHDAVIAINKHKADEVNRDLKNWCTEDFNE